MGVGWSGGLSLGGRLEGSSKSKSPKLGSSGDLSSGVYCGGASVDERHNNVMSLLEKIIAESEQKLQRCEV